MQHTRLPCPSPTPGACSNSCPLRRWCYPTISSSVIPFSSCLQPFSASGSFPISQFFASDGQSIGASASVLPMNIQGWFPLGWTDWISLQSKEHIGPLPTWGAHLPVSYLFIFSHCSWGSHGKNPGVVCRSLLQWTMFCQNSPPWPFRRGWPCTEWLLASLSYTSPLTTTRLWSMKGKQIRVLH